MSSSEETQLGPDAREVLRRLRSLHISEGEPSSRVIAASAGLSHTTINSALREDRLPSWPVLSKVVQALNGDESEFRDLWARARDVGIKFDELPSPGRANAEVSVFLSYARVDDKATHSRISFFVEDIQSSYESLTGLQVGVFKDTDSIEPGEAWRDRISFGLSSSSILLAFLSPAYLRSGPCQEEFWEFHRFLESNSMTRLIIPLLFGDINRIERQYSDNSLWLESSELNRIDISELRFEERGSSHWLRSVNTVAERVDSVLSSLNDRENVRRGQDVESHVEDEDDGAEEAGEFLDKMATLEDTADGTNTTLEDISGIFEEIGAETADAAAKLDNATSAKGKLQASVLFAAVLDPLSVKLENQVGELREGMRTWDEAVQASVSLVTRYPSQLEDVGVREGLQSIREMAYSGLDGLQELDHLEDAIRQAQGLSARLNKPLKRIRRAVISISQLRGMFKGWIESLDSTELMNSND